ncbi:RcnB family protein [Sphingomonas sp. LB3N6]|uniref:RcnB family protein n=1 Tax=Sphingomonas fucosidasi TaxID=3096164 RepID=UPI002FC9DA5C
MKKFILMAVAASLVPGSAIAASQQHQPAQRHTTVQQKVVAKQAPQRTQYRSDWRKGERFDSGKARNYRQIDYRKYRGLKAPPRGYRYVQSGNDAVLVGISTGIIAAIFANAVG